MSRASGCGAGSHFCIALLLQPLRQLQGRPVREGCHSLLASCVLASLVYFFACSDQCDESEAMSSGAGEGIQCGGLLRGGHAMGPTGCSKNTRKGAERRSGGSVLQSEAGRRGLAVCVCLGARRHLAAGRSVLRWSGWGGCRSAPQSKIGLCSYAAAAAAAVGAEGRQAARSLSARLRCSLACLLACAGRSCVYLTSLEARNHLGSSMRA